MSVSSGLIPTLKRHIWPGPGLTPEHRVAPFDASGRPSNRHGSICCVQRILLESREEPLSRCLSWLWVRKAPLKEQRVTAAAGTSQSWGCSDYQMVGDLAWGSSSRCSGCRRAMSLTPGVGFCVLVEKPAEPSSPPPAVLPL